MRTTRLLLEGVLTLALVGGLSAALMAQDDGPVPADLVAATEANEAAYIEAFWAEDIDAVMATFTEDAVFEDQLFGDYLEGAEAIRGMYEAVFQITDPGSNQLLDRFVSSDGTRAVQVVRWRGTSGSGKPFDIPTLVLHEYRDGKIAKDVMYYAARDTYAQLAQ
jgi:steroid delta-isomerase-like uncharacterized protein